MPIHASRDAFHTTTYMAEGCAINFRGGTEFYKRLTGSCGSCAEQTLSRSRDGSHESNVPKGWFAQREGFSPTPSGRRPSGRDGLRDGSQRVDLHNGMASMQPRPGHRPSGRNSLRDGSYESTGSTDSQHRRGILEDCGLAREMRRISSPIWGEARSDNSAIICQNYPLTSDGFFGRSQKMEARSHEVFVIRHPA